MKASFNVASYSSRENRASVRGGLKKVNSEMQLCYSRVSVNLSVLSERAVAI